MGEKETQISIGLGGKVKEVRKMLSNESNSFANDTEKEKTR